MFLFYVKMKNRLQALQNLFKLDLWENGLAYFSSPRQLGKINKNNLSSHIYIMVRVLYTFSFKLSCLCLFDTIRDHENDEMK